MERIVKRNWGNAKSIWFPHVTLQKRKGTLSKFRSLHICLSDYIFKCHPSRKNVWTDKETHTETLGPPRNYCEEHYCEEHHKKSGVLPKKDARLKMGRTLAVPLRGSKPVV